MGSDEKPVDATSQQRRACEIADRLDDIYGKSLCPLEFGGDPFRLAVAVSLSAQTTDRQVNSVTPQLFERWPTPYALAAADVSEVAQTIHPVGFFRVKANNIVALAQMLVSDFGGEVPRTMDELQRLPGVGRKSANIVLNEGFGIVEGIAVDTHVNRISHRLGLVSRTKDASRVEQELCGIYPKRYWGRINREWVLFGREVCCAKSPHCDVCPIRDLCNWQAE